MLAPVLAHRDTTDPFDAYSAGGALKDKTCGEMARYMGRLVGWYTNGGMTDECGHWHESGLHYDWFGLSVLNEDEHHIKPDMGQAYTVCFDAIKVRKSRCPFREPCSTLKRSFYQDRLGTSIGKIEKKGVFCRRKSRKTTRLSSPSGPSSSTAHRCRSSSIF